MSFLKFSFLLILVFSSIISYSSDTEITPDETPLLLSKTTSTDNLQELRSKPTMKRNNSQTSTTSTSEVGEYNSPGGICIEYLQHHSRSSTDEGDLIPEDSALENKYDKVSNNLKLLTNDLYDFYSENKSRSIDDDKELLLTVYSACGSYYMQDETDSNTGRYNNESESVCNSDNYKSVSVCNVLKTTAPFVAFIGIVTGLMYNQNWHHGMLPPEFCWKNL